MMTCSFSRRLISPIMAAAFGIRFLLNIFNGSSRISVARLRGLLSDHMATRSARAATSTAPPPAESIGRHRWPSRSNQMSASVRLRRWTNSRTRRYGLSKTADSASEVISDTWYSSSRWVACATACMTARASSACTASCRSSAICSPATTASAATCCRWPFSCSSLYLICWRFIG
jgi:hypothetical protein